MVTHESSDIGERGRRKKEKEKKKKKKRKFNMIPFGNGDIIYVRRFEERNFQH